VATHADAIGRAADLNCPEPPRQPGSIVEAESRFLRQFDGIVQLLPSRETVVAFAGDPAGPIELLRLADGKEYRLRELLLLRGRSMVASKGVAERIRGRSGRTRARRAGPWPSPGGRSKSSSRVTSPRSFAGSRPRS
jgi:hypothetical protein